MAEGATCRIWGGHVDFLASAVIRLIRRFWLWVPANLSTGLGTMESSSRGNSRKVVLVGVIGGVGVVDEVGVVGEKIK